MGQVDSVCIMGMGYVGLTLSVAMAEAGLHVHGIEIDPTVLETLRGGRAHFHEPQLDYLLRRNVDGGRLRFSGAIPEAERFDAFIITVGTPLDDDGKPRMDMVSRVAGQIAAHMADDSLVVLRSTVRLGTTRNVVKPILDGAGVRYGLAFCPERTMMGKALEELPVLPQIVGGVDAESRDRAGQLFQRITPTILKVSDLGAAELIKLLDNSYRDMVFAFGNEVAVLCEKLGVDATEVIKTANLGYPRTDIAWPGFVGGPCLQKDPHILIDSLKDVEHEPRMVKAARALNEELVDYVFERALAALSRRDGLRIAILGLAFKGEPETDDLRGSPALLMIERIRRELPDARIKAQDYRVRESAMALLGVTPVDDVEAFRDSDIVFIMNNNLRYRTLDVESRAATMARPGVIFDAWNAVYRNLALPEGVTLHALGR